MMTLPMNHFNRARFVLAAAVLVPTALAAQLPQAPERLRATPELRGRLSANGVPVAGARIALILGDSALKATGCRTRSAATTGDSGEFRVDATWQWFTRERSAALRRGELRDEFYLCIQLRNETTGRGLYQAPAFRWDTLHLACDLYRPWLPPDAEGRQGHCTSRAAVDHAVLAGPAAGARSPDLTCDTSSAVIERLRIGPVRVNGSVAELRRLCPSLRDTTLTAESWAEPSTSRALVLTIAGTPVIIEFSAGVVARISVRQPGLKTTDSIGVGSPFAMLRRRSELYVVTGMEPPFALAFHGPECGNAFLVPHPAQKPSGKIVFVSEDSLRKWPRTTSVKRVIVGFCPNHNFPQFMKP